jgi:predicted dehydrogenase
MVALDGVNQVNDASRVRMAIVGVGRWGTRAHLTALSDRDDVEIVGIADPVLENVRAIADRYNIKHAYADARALFRDVKDLDAVILATPTDTHRDLCLDAFESGLHVFCEKPLAYDVGQAREMVAAARSGGLIGKVGFLFRHSPVVGRMKRLVDEGYIGNVTLFESVTVNHQFVDPLKPLHWKMQRARAGGGVSVEYGSHSIDLALWFGGPISRVVAHGVTLIRTRQTQHGVGGTVDVDDAASWIAEYTNGGEALFRTGWASLPVGGGGVRVYGSRGSLGWQLDPTARRREQLVAWAIDEPAPRVLMEFAPPFDARFDEGPYPMGLLARYNARLVEGFVHDLRNGRGSAPSFEDGLAAQRVLQAVRTSMDEQRWADVEAD